MPLFDLSYYRDELRGAFSFARRPSDSIEEVPLAAHISPFTALVVAGVCLSLLATVPLIVIQATGLLPPHAGGGAAAPLALTSLLVLGAIAVPFIEESAFRGILRPTHVTLTLATAAWTYFAVGFAQHGSLAVIHWDATLIELSLRTICTIAVLGLTYAGARKWGDKVLPSHGWGKAFPFLFWAILAAFALAHLGRYGAFESRLDYLLAPLLVLPQLVAGVIFGFARMRYGLLAAMIAHGLNNGILTLLFAWL